MKRLMMLIIIMTTLTACQGKGGSNGSSAETLTSTSGHATDPGTNDNEGPPTDSDLPALALSFGTNVTLMDFQPAQEEKYNEAIALVKKVVGTEAFRDQVLNYTYNGVKQFANNNGLTNAQIYQTILDAAERLTPAKNNIMDVGVKLYYEDSSTVGYTSGSISYINVNTKFFDKYTASSVASNLFHEWLHKVGYGHDVAATTARPHSVPYAVGYIVGDIARSFL
jgi:hypothetical protein